MIREYLCDRLDLVEAESYAALARRNLALVSAHMDLRRKMYNLLDISPSVGELLEEVEVNEVQRQDEGKYW